MSEMFEPDRQYETDSQLRLGLRSLPVPEISADFDARLQAVLRPPVPWWRVAWASVCPVLAPTACSFVVMLALLQGMSHTPQKPSPAASSGSAAAMTQERKARLDALDRGMERRDLSHASLIGRL